MQMSQATVQVNVPLKPLQRIDARMLSTMAADAGRFVENWIGIPVAAPQIRTAPGQSTTVILADDVEFPERRYTFGGKAPNHIILIANTIRLMGQLSISVPDLTLVAHRFLCGREGLLNFPSNGNLNVAIE